MADSHTNTACSDAQPPSRKRRTLAAAVQFTVSVGLIVWAVTHIDLGAAWSRLQAASWPLLGLAWLVLALQVPLHARRWQRVNARLELEEPWLWHLRTAWVGLFFSQVLPGSIGGDAYRMWSVARPRGHGWKAGLLSVICDRALGLTILLVLMVATLPFLAIRIGVGEPFVAVAVTAVGGLAAAVTVIAYGRVPFCLSFMKVADVLMAPARGLKTVLSGPRELPIQLIYGIAIHLVMVLAFWLVGASLALPFTLLEALAVIPPVALLTVLPVSLAGWGVREGAMIAAFALLGYPAADALVLSLILGVAGLAVGLVGGAILMAGACRARFRSA